VVVATGMATELGRLAELRSGTPAEPTPPQRRLAVLGRWMAAATPVVCAVVFAVGVAKGEPREVGHPPAVLKVPPSTGRMALVYRPRSGEAAARGG